MIRALKELGVLEGVDVSTGCLSSSCGSWFSGLGLLPATWVQPALLPVLPARQLCSAVAQGRWHCISCTLMALDLLEATL